MKLMALLHGDCGASGSNVTWTFEQHSRNMRIEGTGDMADYDTPDTRPWKKILKRINSLTIEGGVTRVGTNAFTNADSIGVVTINRVDDTPPCLRSQQLQVQWQGR